MADPMEDMSDEEMRDRDDEGEEEGEASHDPVGDDEDYEGEEREALKVYKEKQQKEKAPNPHAGKLKFRSYTPRDNILKDLRLPTPALPSMVDEITQKLVKMEAQQEQDLINLAPKKPNWDLKRDLEKKLDVLEKRTQRAIVKILKDKLEVQKASGEAS